MLSHYTFIMVTGYYGYWTSRSLDITVTGHESGYNGHDTIAAILIMIFQRR